MPLQGDIAWFLNGKLNASTCCIDQHLPHRADKVRAHMEGPWLAGAVEPPAPEHTCGDSLACSHQVAIIWEGDEPGETKTITYGVRTEPATSDIVVERVSRGCPASMAHGSLIRGWCWGCDGTRQELHKQVCRIANAMKAQGVRKGDVVMIYMPMVPEIAMVMLACARIGAPHR